MDQSKDNQNHADEFPVLSREIFVGILLCLPAPFLREVGRRVCRLWHNIISDLQFMKEHYSIWKDAMIINVGEEEHLLHFEEGLGCDDSNFLNLHNSSGLCIGDSKPGVKLCPDCSCLKNFT